MTEASNTDLYIVHITKTSVNYLKRDKWLKLEELMQLVGNPNESNYIKCVYNRFVDANIVAVVDDIGAASDMPWVAVLPWQTHIYGNLVICGIDTNKDGERDICAIKRVRLNEAMKKVRLVE